MSPLSELYGDSFLPNSLSRQVIEEMTPYRVEFLPEHFIVLAKDSEVMDEETETFSIGRYVIGRTNEGVNGLFSVPSVTAIPVQIPNERVERLLGEKFECFETVSNRVVELLIMKGYRDITLLEKKELTSALLSLPLSV